jgi:glycolate oxidase
MGIIEDLRKIAGERACASPSELRCYSSDASQVEGRPDFVVRHKSAEEVSSVVQLADRRAFQ